MKFSVALSLCLAPMVLAKSVRNSAPARREARNNNKDNNNDNSKGVSAGTLAAAEAAAVQAGLLLGSLSQVVIIWVNGGNGAATTTINSVQTVTQTVTAGGAAAATTAAAAETTVANGAATSVAAGTATTVATGALTTHTVTVGGPKGLVYEPSSISAAVGDMVVFTFLSQNHTVSQSAFATPCELLAGGMDSGFQPNVNNTVNPPPQVALQVMVATPLWFYCRQNGHCGKGMTFSINPTANKTQAMFQQMAIAQNGTGTGSAITGGTTSAAAVGTTTTAAGAVAGTAATSAAAAATSSATDSTAGTGLTTGTGTVNSDGSCSCAVVCNSNAFPAVQAQGIGAFGGFGGSVPMSALALR